MVDIKYCDLKSTTRLFCICKYGIPHMRLKFTHISNNKSFHSLSGFYCPMLSHKMVGRRLQNFHYRDSFLPSFLRLHFLKTKNECYETHKHSVCLLVFNSIKVILSKCLVQKMSYLAENMSNKAPAFSNLVSEIVQLGIDPGTTGMQSIYSATVE